MYPEKRNHKQNFHCLHLGKYNSHKVDRFDVGFDDTLVVDSGDKFLDSLNHRATDKYSGEFLLAEVESDNRDKTSHLNNKTKMNLSHDREKNLLLSPQV